MDALDKLAELQDGWDGYNAPPISKLAIATCRLLHFTPLSSGGILIEMHTEEGSAEIEVDELGRLSQVSADLSTAKARPRYARTQTDGAADPKTFT